MVAGVPVAGAGKPTATRAMGGTVRLKVDAIQGHITQRSGMAVCGALDRRWTSGEGSRQQLEVQILLQTLWIKDGRLEKVRAKAGSSNTHADTECYRHL